MKLINKYRISRNGIRKTSYHIVSEDEISNSFTIAEKESACDMSFVESREVIGKLIFSDTDISASIYLYEDMEEAKQKIIEELTKRLEKLTAASHAVGGIIDGLCKT